MKKYLFSIILMLSATLTASAQLSDYSIFKKQFNVFIANDLGRNGYYDQKPIAELMGRMAEAGASPEFVLATGDVHHFNGVASVNDPLWMTNYELIYSHPELMIEYMIQMVEVNKVVTPDMDADAIGGSINLVTKSSPYRQSASASTVTILTLTAA